jgi:hypothetical protein
MRHLEKDEPGIVETTAKKIRHSLVPVPPCLGRTIGNKLGGTVFTFLTFMLQPMQGTKKGHDHNRKCGLTTR